MDILSLFSKMEQFIKDNKRMGKDMDGENRHFKMDLGMKECGRMMYLMEEEYLYKVMEEGIKDSLRIN